jgi:hypothetical protein
MRYDKTVTYYNRTFSTYVHQYISDSDQLIKMEEEIMNRRRSTRSRSRPPMEIAEIRGEPNTRVSSKYVYFIIIVVCTILIHSVWRYESVEYRIKHP